VMKKETLLYRTAFTIRILVLCLTLYLVYNGWGVYSGTNETSLLMYANLTCTGFWLLFMMGSILVSPFGRFFCALCPVGETNHLFSKIGLKRYINVKLDFLQGFSLILVFILVIVFHFSKHPHLTSLLILSVITVAAIMGLLCKGNSFCLLLCPANAYLRFYSRLSFFKISCKDKSTVSPCMVMLNPCNVKKEQCHLCFRCFKDAEGVSISFDKKPLKNLALPFSNVEIFIFSVLSGLTVMAFIRVVAPVRELFVFPPYLIAQYFGLGEEHIIFLLVLFGVFLYPAICYLAFLVLMRIFAKNSMLELAKSFLPFFIPLILSIHLILALAKMNARIGFLPFALTDPSGRDMVKLYLSSKIDIPSDLISIAYFKYILLILPIVAFFLTIYLIKNYVKTLSEKTALIIIQSTFFLFIEYCVVSWLFKGVFL